MLALDEERAIAALPKLAPDRRLLQRGFDAARTVMSARGELTPQQEERFRRAAFLPVSTAWPAAMSQHEPQKYQRLIDAATALPPVVTAVAHPCSENALAAAVDAARQG